MLKIFHIYFYRNLKIYIIIIYILLHSNNLEIILVNHFTVECKSLKSDPQSFPITKDQLVPTELIDSTDLACLSDS